MNNTKKLNQIIKEIPKNYEGRKKLIDTIKHYMETKQTGEELKLLKIDLTEAILLNMISDEIIKDFIETEKRQKHIELSLEVQLHYELEKYNYYKQKIEFIIDIQKIFLNNLYGRKK